MRSDQRVLEGTRPRAHRLASFVELLVATGIMAICAGASAHLGFLAMKGTGLRGFAQYEAVVQEVIFAVFTLGIIAASVVRMVRIDIELLKQGSARPPRSRPAPPLSLHGDHVVGRGVR